MLGGCGGFQVMGEQGGGGTSNTSGGGVHRAGQVGLRNSAFEVVLTGPSVRLHPDFS